MRVTYDMPADFKVGGPDLGYLAARHFLKTESLARARVDLIEDIKRQDGLTTITCLRSIGRC